MRKPSPVLTPVWPVSSAQAPWRMFAGTSGWAYPTWRPGFYPEGLSPTAFLPYYASRLNTVEVNYTFRALPSAEVVAGWLAATPPCFRFSFKAPQRITHLRRLRECEEAVEEFLEALAPVQDAGRLGLLLFQLPPNLPVDAARLRAFLAMRTLRGPVAMAWEFRHPSWFCPEVYRELERHNAALCIADTDTLETPEVHTSVSHACFRLRRDGGYTAGELARFAERFSALAANRDVYVHLRHQDEPTGALNADALLRLCEQRAGRALLPSATGPA